MSKHYCQSCSMPMEATDEMHGTNNDGSKNEDYCKYCFVNGAFTVNCTMAEMIEFCLPHMVSANEGMDEDNARQMLTKFFPTLKRWASS